MSATIGRHRHTAGHLLSFTHLAGPHTVIDEVILCYGESAEFFDLGWLNLIDDAARLLHKIVANLDRWLSVRIGAVTGLVEQIHNQVKLALGYSNVKKIRHFYPLCCRTLEPVDCEENQSTPTNCVGGDGGGKYTIKLHRFSFLPL
jgi:hypothetical protein